MYSSYSVFLRTTAGVRTTKDILATIINSPLRQYEDYEIFKGSFLGIGITIEWMDEDLNQKIVQFEDEYIPLATYDLEIKIRYEKHLFIRDHSNDLKRTVATVLADYLCLNLSCETLAVRNYDEAFAKYVPFEARVRAYD